MNLHAVADCWEWFPVLLFSVFVSQIIFFFKRSILQKYSSPCSIYWISWQILVNCRNIGTGTPHWHNFLKCWINHFALVSHYAVWRYLENDAVELAWNETMTFRIKKTRCKDYSEKEKTFFAIQFNISWFLPILRINDFYLSLSSHTEQYVAGKLFQSKSVQYMSCKGKFYVKIQWNSVRKSFRGRAFEDAFGLSPFYIFFDNPLESGCRQCTTFWSEDFLVSWLLHKYVTSQSRDFAVLRNLANSRFWSQYQ